MAYFSLRFPFCHRALSPHSAARTLPSPIRPRAGQCLRDQPSSSGCDTRVRATLRGLGFRAPGSVRQHICSARIGPNLAYPLCGERGNFGTPTSARGVDPQTLNAEQSSRIAVAFARAVTRSPPASLCDACVELLMVSGAGITVMGGGQTGQLCVSSQRMATLEELQFTMGVGPCQDAFRTGQPVHAPNLGVAAVSRWPAFVTMARGAGIGSVFAYPLALNGAKIGVMTLYQDLEGELSTVQHDDSIAMAEVLTETVLSLQDAAPEGVLAEGLQEAVSYRAEVHQASGMVSIQLKIPVAEAVVRIRAHAFARDLPVGVVAAEIVARRLRLADDRQQPGEGV